MLNQSMHSLTSGNAGFVRKSCTMFYIVVVLAHMVFKIFVKNISFEVFMLTSIHLV